MDNMHDAGITGCLLLVATIVMVAVGFIQLRKATPAYINRVTRKMSNRLRPIALHEIGQVQATLGDITVKEVDRIVRDAWMKLPTIQDGDTKP